MNRKMYNVAYIFQDLLKVHFSVILLETFDFTENFAFEPCIDFITVN